MVELKRYESVVVFTSSLSAKEFGACIKSIEGFVKEKGGEFIYTEKVGMIDLAYQIKKNNKGFFFFFDFKIPAGAIEDLNIFYRRDERIIRYIIVSLDEKGVEYNDTFYAKKGTVKKSFLLVKEEKEKKNTFIEATTKMYCRFKRFGIKYIDYKNVTFLFNFLNPQGKILPRRLSGNSVKFQKKVAAAVKRARHLAILPFVTDNLK